jgi:RNA polymerase sigma factor (sigma-70 family)
MASYLKDVKYHGPAKDTARWDGFARSYTQNGKDKEKVAAINTLDAMAFSKKGAQGVLAEHGIKVRDVAELQGPAKKTFATLRTDIEEACAAYKAYHSKRNKHWARHDPLAAALLPQWIALELTAFRSLSVKTDAGEIIPTRPDQILRKPTGKLLAGALWMLRDIPYDGPLRTVEITMSKDLDGKSTTTRRGVDLPQLWNEFARNYTQDGTRPENMREIAQLNALAFGKGGLSSLLPKQHIKLAPEVSLMDEYARERFTVLKTSMEHICQANSAATIERRPRPLNKALSVALTNQWIELERAVGLFPPPRRASHEGITEEERIRVNTLREELLRTPKGAFISGMLWMLNDSVIGAETAKVYKKFLHTPLTREDAHDAAVELFNASLFGFDPVHGASLATYVGNHIRVQLPKKLHQLAAKEHPGSLDRPDRETGRSLLNKLADDGATPQSISLDREMRQRLLTAMKRRLNERERDIITRRIGLNGQPPQTLEAIAQIYGIKRERIRQVQDKAFEKLRKDLGENRWAKRDEIEESPKPRNPDVIARLPQPREESFGNMVRDYREALGITPDSFAEQIQSRLRMAIPTEERQRLTQEKGRFITDIESEMWRPSGVLAATIIGVLDAHLSFVEADRRLFDAAYERDRLLARQLPDKGRAL